MFSKKYVHLKNNVTTKKIVKLVSYSKTVFLIAFENNNVTLNCCFCLSFTN